MFDSLISFFGIDFLNILTFSDVIEILIRLFFGVLSLKVIFSFVLSVLPFGGKSVFRGL